MTTWQSTNFKRTEASISDTRILPAARRIRFGFFLLVSGLLSLIGCHSRLDLMACKRIEKTVVIEPGGRQLTSFFVGLRPDPMFSAAAFRREDESRPRIASGCSASGNGVSLTRITSFLNPEVVQASTGCVPTICTGSKKINEKIPCVGACTLTYNDTYTDASGNINDGAQQDGNSSCNGAPGISCHCNSVVCQTNVPGTCTTGSPCDPYTSNSCPAGQRCSNSRCCEPASCPSGQKSCNVDYPDCVDSTQGDCSGGCCVPHYCNTNEGCWEQYYCVVSLHKCKPASCGGQQPCHNNGDCSPYTTCQISTGCCTEPPPPSPILIDVEGDGFLLTSADTGVLFDIAATHKPARLSWTDASSDDSFLALDRNNNGRIDDGSELFGNATQQPDGPDEKHGFRALAVYDQPREGGNGDGVIDARDAVFSKLLLWRDTNHNGISEQPELTPLAASSVTAISLDYKKSKWTDAYGNKFRFRAKISSNKGDTPAGKWAYDVFFVFADVQPQLTANPKSLIARNER